MSKINISYLNQKLSSAAGSGLFEIFIQNNRGGQQQ